MRDETMRRRRKTRQTIWRWSSLFVGLLLAGCGSSGLNLSKPSTPTAPLPTAFIAPTRAPTATNAIPFPPTAVPLPTATAPPITTPTPLSAQNVAAATPAPLARSSATVAATPTTPLLAILATSPPLPTLPPAVATASPIAPPTLVAAQPIAATAIPAVIAPTASAAPGLRTITKAQWGATPADRRAALVLAERGVDLPNCTAAQMAGFISDAYGASATLNAPPYQLYQSILAGEQDCDPTHVNDTPVDFDVVTGGQWLPLPVATKTAAMQWYIVNYPNFIGPCANPTPPMLIALADKYAARADMRDQTIFTVMTIALAQNGCLR